MSRARSALRVRWLKLRPRPSKKPQKANDCGFLVSLWFFGELVVFGRACGSLFQSRDKGQIAKEFDDRVEVVLVTRIGGGYGYD